MIDKHSETWAHIRKWALARKCELIEQLIDANSELTRGRIQQLNDLLQLTTEDVLPIVQQDNYLD